MPTPIVVLDANVLYAIELTDLFLTFGTQRLARLHWSPTILEEVRRNLALRPDLDPRAIDYRIGRMNAALPAALDEAPAVLVDAMTNHPKDRHVLALAVHVGASRVVTNNLRDFPDSACREHGIEAISPDQFATFIATTDPTGVRHALGAVAARRRQPPTTVDQLLNRLAAPMPTFVTNLRTPITPAETLEQ